MQDFFNIVREDYIERYNEFLIDNDLLRKWLQINNRRAFNDTIKKNYKKDTDYLIEKNMFIYKFKNRFSSSTIFYRFGNNIIQI